MNFNKSFDISEEKSIPVLFVGGFEGEKHIFGVEIFLRLSFQLYTFNHVHSKNGHFQHAKNTKIWRSMWN